MPVTELSSAYVTPYDPRRRAAERRPPREPFPRPQPEIPLAPAAFGPAPLPPMFRPDLSQLSAAAAPTAAAVSGAALDLLVAAIRDGDLAKARAAFAALETEMLVERSTASAGAAPEVAASDVFAPVVMSVHAADDAYETLSHYLDADGHV